MTAIRLTGLTKTWGDGSPAISIDELEVAHGEFFGLIGPSGSGKSTLLRLLAGLTNPDSGSIEFDGSSVAGLEPSQREIGYVVQEGNLYNTMSVEDNIGFPLFTSGVDKASRHSRVADHSTRFGLFRLLDKRPRRLSAGYQHLTATGRATIRPNRLLLMDEPMTALDTHIRVRLRERLRQLKDGSLTIIYATNDQAEAFALSDRMAVIHEGRIRQVGPPLDLFHRPVDTFVAEFVGEPGMNIVPAVVDSATGTLCMGDDRIALSSPAPIVGPCLIGLRAEVVRPAAPGDPFDQCLHAAVTEVERRGSYDLAHVAFGGPDSGALDFKVRMMPGHTYQRGQQIELYLDQDQLVYFDRASGLRVAA